MGTKFVLSCRHCLQSVVIVTAGIADAELARLRDHLRDCRPHEPVEDTFRVDTALRHFRVTIAATDASSR